MLDTRATLIEPGRDIAYLKEITSEQVRQVLTAGAKGQTVLDGGPGGHSVFTGRLIELLENANDYITARELGQKLKKQVFADAAARGHEQRPVDGEIYGTGDFVFVPDLAKRSRDLNVEVSSLEAEMVRLNRLKQEAEASRDSAKQREIERQQLVKQAELKQAQVRRKQQEETVERQRQEAIEAEKQAKAHEQQGKENEQRLAMLREQAEKMRKELGADLSGGTTIESAVSEMKRIKQQRDMIQQNFSEELRTQAASLSQFYDQKISRLAKLDPWDKEFETKDDYNKRLAAAEAQAAPVRQEKELKLAELRKDLTSAKLNQIEVFEKQVKTIEDKRFTLPAADVSFKFLSYDLNSQKMFGEASLSGDLYFFKALIPKTKAREYKQTPSLLVPEAKMRATLNGGELAEIIFHGPVSGETYNAKPCNSIGMEFVYIEPGTFTMGSPQGEPGRVKDEQQHPVTLTQGYYLQTTEVTQGQWRAVMGSNPSKFKDCGDDCPVEIVSWEEVQDFIAKLNQKEGVSRYRLPTEAEWEYAARAGSQTRYCFGDSENQLGNYAWYDANSGDSTHAVGQKQPNAWGLYDMHGNVWEWCQDWYGDYPSAAVTDPTRPSGGSDRVLRGGSWFAGWGGRAGYCRSADRYGREPGAGTYELGLRLARNP